VSKFYGASVGRQARSADARGSLFAVVGIRATSHLICCAQVSSIYNSAAPFIPHAFLSHPALTSFNCESYFPSHPLPSTLLTLMYIRLQQLVHVPFPGMQKSVSHQMAPFGHPSTSQIKPYIKLHVFGCGAQVHPHPKYCESLISQLPNLTGDTVTL